ncbi:MAG: alkaline phosphatase PafA [Flavobacteriaceae bacterium]
MNTKLLPLVFLLVFVCCDSPIQSSKPKLVVGIVVDQMRMDYLTRFENHYGNDGFKRFYHQGFVAKNHHFDYAQTKTGPGHASISTGTPPAIHGIIGNDWFDKATGEEQYCVGDAKYQGVGTYSEAGKKAPTQLLVSTFADENRLATQSRGKAIGISIKDRSAILSIGHAANGAYWFSGKDEGKFVSSTFYMDALPQWAEDFNSKRVIDNYMTTWETYSPMETYIESGSDNTPYERVFKGKETPTFPYDLASLAQNNGGYDIIEETPFGNSLVTDFALAALKGENLGTDADADVLMISYSSTDYVGHAFGINSKELQDTYVRLDMDLARLFAALDKQVGKGQYTVFLSSDHGVAHVPQYLMDNKIPAGYFKKKDFENKIKEHLASFFGTDTLIRNISNNEIFLDYDALAAKSLDPKQIKSSLVSLITSFEGIAAAYDTDALLKMNENNPLIERLQRGHHPKRSGDIVFSLLPGHIATRKKGTTHGSAYIYDTHVPLMLFGAGVKKGSTYERTNITDIAPTICAILGISNPTGTIGNPIGSALK